MKKSVLALSITAAVAGLGFAGGAQAMVGALGGATVGTEMLLNGDGVGHMLLVPYFTAQADNATLINLVNTDTGRGKAVKVRFRGASNSDDIFDFQVFLSPGDVWTANISKGSDGRAKLTTSDATCTKPKADTLNTTPFVTSRLDPDLTADQKANNTREGYVEIFNMADIPPLKANTVVDVDSIVATTAGVDASASGANPLFTAIKHVKSVAPCSGTAWTNLDIPSIGGSLSWNTAVASATTPRSAGLLPPTTGLMANWTIINVVGAAAWSGAATAVQAGIPAGYPVDSPRTGNVVYWPQTSAPVGVPAINDYTADPLLRSTYVVDAAYAGDATPAVVGASYDLPDMSTPYSAFGSGIATVDQRPLAQAAVLTHSIAAVSATNEFLTTTSISASTDWVFSMPTRRYSIALDYAAIGGGDDGRRFTNLFEYIPAADPGVRSYFNADNTLVTSRQICVKGIVPYVYDREENTLAATTDVVVSPSTPADPLSFCGEASVLSINNGGVSAGSGALKASIALKDLDVTYKEGWMKLVTPAATPAALALGNYTPGLPVLGASFARAWAGSNSFGTAHPHRFQRISN